MCFSFRLVLGMVAALVCWPATVQADPLTFTYRIDVTERCTPTGCTPFLVSFPLTLSFDSSVTRADGEPDAIVRQYGAPTFSDIPLERPGVMTGARTFASTVDIAVFVPPFDWRHVADAQSGAQLLTDDFDYRWHLGLFEAQDFFPSPPTLAPTSFAAFLGSGMNARAFGFSFAGLHRRTPGGLSPDSVGFSGAAILQDRASPVPEPMSLLLVGSGLAALGMGRRRRRRIVI